MWRAWWGRRIGHIRCKTVNIEIEYATICVLYAICYNGCQILLCIPYLNEGDVNWKIYNSVDIHIGSRRIHVATIYIYR